MEIKHSNVIRHVKERCINLIDRDNKLLLREIENPVTDIDFQAIYDKIKGATISADLKTEYMNALMAHFFEN